MLVLSKVFSPLGRGIFDKVIFNLVGWSTGVYRGGVTPSFFDHLFSPVGGFSHGRINSLTQSSSQSLAQSGLVVAAAPRLAQSIPADFPTGCLLDKNVKNSKVRRSLL